MAKADFPEPVKELIGELKRLPGVGPRSAERIALWLLQNKKADQLAMEAAEKIQLAGSAHSGNRINLCKRTR